MRSYGLMFHHFGLAVAKKEQARKFLAGLGYTLGEELHDPLQKVRLCMATHPAMPAVELITKSDEPGPLEHILQDAPERIYHLCFHTENLEHTLAAIKQDGHRLICISKPKPAILFDGKQVAFYVVTGFGLIEILILQG
ncbi:MAG: VOC family protein [Magnetococcales bacterium]|nr:VOC family protein [Magnetococcales bacterium]MBF0323151.1 VOC family protein [Magnetococcales bacterium]